jgi:hypothetical protein
MQVGGAVRGTSTTPPPPPPHAPPGRGRLKVLLAIVAAVAVFSALVVWAAPLARSGVGTEDAAPNAGSAVIHDDSWNMPDNADPAVVYDDGSNLHAST